MCGRGLGEQESPDAHCGVLDVAGLQHTVEMVLDLFEVKLAIGLVRLVEYHKTEYVFFDAVPHRCIVGMGAFEESLYRKQSTGVAGEVVQAHPGETQGVHLDGDGSPRVLVDAELHVHGEVLELQGAVEVDTELIESVKSAVPDKSENTT